MKELPGNFEKLEFIRPGFPDACVIQKNGKEYSRKYIEFEFLSSGFRSHMHNPKHRETQCDYIVCWENDSHANYGVPVIELKSEIEKILAAEREAA